MGTTLNKKAYKQLIQEDLEWLYKQKRTLERDHIISIVQNSVNHYYPDAMLKEGDKADDD